MVRDRGGVSPTPAHVTAEPQLFLELLTHSGAEAVAD